MSRKLTNKEFIDKARKVHGDKYDYSKTVYTLTNAPIIVICPTHGEFTINAHHHIGGHGCQKCAREHSSKLRTLTTEDFIAKAHKVHGDKYDYSKVVYEKCKKKIIIICPEHGEFKITPLNHLQGQGCAQCGINKRVDASKMSFEDFKKRSNEIHDNKYAYDEDTYTSLSKKLRIICPEHGEFWQNAGQHSRGCGCQKCGASTHERDVMKLLNKNNIEYIHQCRNNVFPWLEKQSLDFYLPEYNLAIECQGSQHFGLGGWGHNFDFMKVYENDIRKYNLLVEHGIEVLYYCFSGEIWKEKLPFYTDNNIITKVEDILKKMTNTSEKLTCQEIEI